MKSLQPYDHCSGKEYLHRQWANHRRGVTNPEVVGIEAFTLIIHALLIVRYGLDALKITAKKLTHRFSPDGSAFSWKDQLALAA